MALDALMLLIHWTVYLCFAAVALYFCLYYNRCTRLLACTLTFCNRLSLGDCVFMQGTVLDVRKLLEAHPLYSTWLDWSPSAGSRTMPAFHAQVAWVMRHTSCFKATEQKVGRGTVYRYCPELLLAPTTTKAGSTKGQRGYTAMGRTSANMN
jgi:hypothetical protein